MGMMCNMRRRRRRLFMIKILDAET